MVKRYEFEGWRWNGPVGEENSAGQGEVFSDFYVLHSDYLLLQAALKEALEGWHSGIGQFRNHHAIAQEDRISALRAQFLGD